jgi:hypothetical protein
MAEPLNPDHEARQAPLPGSNSSEGSNEGLTEDDLDIDALLAVWKDDLLLDAIGGASSGCDRLDVPFDVSADRQLIEALLSWQRHIESDPLAPLCRDWVEDSATCGLRRHKFRVPLVSALAAAVVLAFTALAAYGATPDEALWPVTEVLYSQHAASVRAADDADAAQAQAEAAMAAGQTPAAQAALRTAASRIPQVRSEDGQTKLQTRQHELERQLDAPPSPAAARTSVAAPGAQQRNPKTFAAPKPTSQRTTHSSRPESPARTTESRDSIALTGSPTTTSPTHPTSRPATTSSTPPQRPEQLSKPPRATRSTGARTTDRPPTPVRPDVGAAHNNGERAEPVNPRNKKSAPATRLPEAKPPMAPMTGQEFKPSSSARTTENQRLQAATERSNSPAPTSRARATTSPYSGREGTPPSATARAPAPRAP